MAPLFVLTSMRATSGEQLWVVCVACASALLPAFWLVVVAVVRTQCAWRLDGCALQDVPQEGLC